MQRGARHYLGPGKNDATVRQGQAGGLARDAVFSCTMFYLSLDLVRNMVEDLSRRPLGTPKFTVMVSDRPDVCVSLRRLVLCFGMGDGLVAESALVRTVGEVLQAHGVMTGDDCDHDRTFVRRAWEILAADLDRKVAIRDMAAVLGVSQYHFLRAFKRQTGLPSHVFRTQRRMELARSLVRSGMPLSEMAQHMGFTDQAHFTNTFKLYAGMKPGRYAGSTRPIPRG